MLMVLSLLKSGGIKCQASGFNLWVDPASEGRISSPQEEEEQKRLILKTEGELQVSFPATETVIQFPGEYEVSGVKIKGYEVSSEADSKMMKTIYMVEMDEITLCFLGAITKEIGEEILDKLEEIDILFLPVGVPFISLKQALALVKELEPRIVIPTGGKEIAALAKEMGEKSESQDKLTIKSKDLEERGTKFIWLTAK